jgi:hypothetical protein
LEKLRRLHEVDEGWSRPALHELSERWRWAARTNAWDEEQDRSRRQVQSEAIQEMAERQARDGMDMQRLARGAMAKWVKPDPATGQLVLATTLSPAEVVRLYRIGFEVERLARGEPTQVTEEKRTQEIYDEELISAGIEYALSRARTDASGVAGGRETDCLPVSTEVDAGAVAGGALMDSGQAESDSSPAVESDPTEAGE